MSELYHGQIIPTAFGHIQVILDKIVSPTNILYTRCNRNKDGLEPFLKMTANQWKSLLILKTTSTRKRPDVQIFDIYGDEMALIEYIPFNNEWGEFSL